MIIIMDEDETCETKAILYDCPCSSSKCCSEPDIVNPEHECAENVCEDCFVNFCNNCTKSCSCDL